MVHLVLLFTHISQAWVRSAELTLRADSLSVQPAANGRANSWVRFSSPSFRIPHSTLCISSSSSLYTAMLREWSSEFRRFGVGDTEVANIFGFWVSQALRAVCRIGAMCCLSNRIVRCML
jgi:hypothetical protein